MVRSVASKHAVEGLTKLAALEVARDPVPGATQGLVPHGAARWAVDDGKLAG